MTSIEQKAVNHFFEVSGSYFYCDSRDVTGVDMQDGTVDIHCNECDEAIDSVDKNDLNELIYG